MSSSGVKQSSTGSDGRRIHYAKNNNKKTIPPAAAPSSDSNAEIYGFHPLRSLRNIFFGYRHKERPLSASSACKARSTENLSALSSSRKFNDSDSDIQVASTTATPVTTVAQLLPPTKPAKELTAYDRRRSMPYSQMLSISADDLLETIGWSASVSNSTEQRSSSHANNVIEVPKDTGPMSPRAISDDVTSRGQEHQHQQPVIVISSSSSSAEEAEDFFEEKWSSRDVSRVRQRAFSETLESVTCGTGDFTTDDLDVVDSRYNLDVSVVKNKLAVKQKGKRATALLQQKMAAAGDLSTRIENEPRSPDRAVSETGEDDRHSIDSRPRGSSNGERHNLLDGTELIRDATEPNDGIDKPQGKVKVDRIAEDRLQTAAATATPPGKHISGPAPCTGQKIPISNEQLAEALRRSGTPRAQHIESPGGGKTGVNPGTPPKSFKSAREGRTNVTSLTPAAAAVTPKSCSQNIAEEELRGVTTRSLTSGRSEIPPIPAGDCKKEAGTAVGAEMKATPKIDESAAERQPLKLSNSATGQTTTPSSTNSGVEASTISSAAKNLRARPKTMAPVSGTISNEPAWMAELAAKKKTRDAASNETTNL